MKFIGLDLGTTKVAGACVTVDESNRSVRLTRIISREHDAGLPRDYAFAHLQDPAKIVAVAQSVLEELRRDRDASVGYRRDLSSESAATAKQIGPEQISGLCITGQVHGIIYLDGGGRAVSPLFTWLDSRGGQPYPGETGSYAAVLSRRTGYIIAPGYGTATHFYNVRNDLVPRAAVRAATLLEYATAAFCGGRPFASDPGVAATVGMFDVRQNIFDRAALRSAGLATLQWSDVVPSGSRIGVTSDGVPVFAPIGDNQAGFLGSVPKPESTTLVNVGTGGQVSVWSPDFRQLDPPLEVRPFPGGGYLFVGASLCSGKAYAMLADLFGAVISAVGFSDVPRDRIYEVMNRLAERTASDGEPLAVSTRFQGTRSDEAVRGSISGIGIGNFTLGNLVEGFLSGIAGELYDYFLGIERAAVPGLAGPERSRVPSRELVAIGNGIRKNHALRSAVERLFGAPASIPAHREEAAVGASLCAAVGAGALEGFSGAGSFIAFENV